MMFRPLLLAIVFQLLAGPALAQQGAPLSAPAGIYLLEKTHASLTWRIDHLGMSRYTARFKSFDARIWFDPQDLSKSRVEASIDLSSVETDFVPAGGRDFNAELRSPPFFNVASAPRAVFKSRSVQPLGTRRLKVAGDLTFLGVTRPVDLDVTLNGGLAEHPFVKVPWLGFSAQGRIQRKAWGLDPMPQLTGVGNEVDLFIEAEFIREQ